MDPDFPLSVGHPDNKTAADQETVDRTEVAKAAKVANVGPSREIFKFLVGDWVAQWDQTYQTWFYYNINTGLSSPLLFQDIFYR